MNKQQLEGLVEQLLAETEAAGRVLTREEIEQWAGDKYSKDQRERIFYRYHYLLKEYRKGFLKS